MSDPIEVAMEEVLRPGRYISEHAPFSLVNELESVAVQSPGLTLSTPSGCTRRSSPPATRRPTRWTTLAGISESSAAACSPAG